MSRSLRGIEPLMADAALRFTDMNTQPAAELAERRLRDRGGRSASRRPSTHWYTGPRREHGRPEAVELFHAIYREAMESAVK